MEKSCSNCFFSFFFFFEVPKEICSQCKFPMCSAKCSEEHVKMPECAIMAKHQYFNLSSKFLVFSKNNVQMVQQFSKNHISLCVDLGSE